MECISFRLNLRESQLEIVFYNVVSDVALSTLVKQIARWNWLVNELFAKCDPRNFGWAEKNCCRIEATFLMQGAENE